MRKYVLFVLLMSGLCLSASGQWGGALFGGVGFPVPGGAGVPELRTSLATGLRGEYAKGDGWVFTGEVWHLRQLENDCPSLTAVPMDTAFHVKRYQLMPFVLGAGYRLPFCDWAQGTVYASAGGYFRYLNCQRQTAAAVIDDMGESGWGFAVKASAEVTLWERVCLQVWFTAMGNPFENEDGAIPGSKASVSYNRSHWHLEGYRQCFWGCALGYGF